MAIVTYKMSEQKQLQCVQFYGSGQTSQSWNLLQISCTLTITVVLWTTDSTVFTNITSSEKGIDVVTGESGSRGYNREYHHKQIIFQCISSMTNMLPYLLAYTQFYIQELERAKDPKTLWTLYTTHQRCVCSEAEEVPLKANIGPALLTSHWHRRTWNSMSIVRVALWEQFCF
jgi:hypothetical protein